MNAERVGLGASGSVLVTAMAPPGSSRQGAEGGEEVPCCGGSGFVSDGLVFTSATWLAHLLRITHCPHSMPNGIEWELIHPSTVFHVIFETRTNHKQTANCLKLTTHGPKQTTQGLTESNVRGGSLQGRWGGCGLAVREARVQSVLLLSEVHGCLAGQLQVLGQWRCEVGSRPARGREEGRVGGGGEGELVSVQSVLLPLSCVVVLSVEGLLPRPSASCVRCVTHSTHMHTHPLTHTLLTHPLARSCSPTCLLAH